jgi:hypothetical protein
VFDRLYFEGERSSERNKNRFNVHDGTFVAGRLSFTFGGGGALHFMSSNVARVPSSAAGFRLTRGTPDVTLTIGVTIAPSTSFFWRRACPTMCTSNHPVGWRVRYAET